jgi:beta-glucosidase
LAGGASAEQIANGIASVVKLLHDSFPASRIIMFGMLPREETNYLPVIRRANLLISACADNAAIFYADVGDSFLAPDGSILRDLMPDLLHPSERGYAILANAINMVVARFPQ